MAAIDYIKLIHIAKSAACLDRPSYLQMLFKFGGAKSSTELDEEQRKELLREIKAAAEHRQGWQTRQLKKFDLYRKFAKLTETEARAVLHEVTGVMHESGPGLTQQQFEHVMAALETRLDEQISGGWAKLPSGIDLNYWRNRLPGKMATSRQLFEIRETWNELAGYLQPEKQTDEYLQGIIAQACGRKPGKIIMTVFAARTAIDALKQKLEHEKKKLADAVPF